MFRFLSSVLLTVGLLCGIAASAWGQPPRTRDVLSYQVTCTTTVGQLVTANINREYLTLLNAGTLHVNVGRIQRTTTYGALNAFNGITLHAGATIELKNYRGGLECQTQSGTGSTSIDVLEELN